MIIIIAIIFFLFGYTVSCIFVIGKENKLENKLYKIEKILNDPRVSGSVLLALDQIDKIIKGD